MFEDSSKQRSLERVIRRVLYSLDINDLRNIFLHYQISSTLANDASKSFIVDRILDKVPIEEIVQNKLVISKMIEKFDDLFSAFEEILKSLNYEDLINVCKDLGRSDLETIKNKSEVIEKMVTEIPLTKIWKTKTIQQHLKLKLVFPSSLRKIASDISALKKCIQELSRQQTSLILSSNKITDNLQEFSSHIQRLISLMKSSDLIDLEKCLRIFYEESLKIEERISPEQIIEASEEMPRKLGAERQAFILKGLEIMILYYLLSQVKNLLWKPSFDDFMRIAKEEFEKIKGIDGRAEIPVLRERVCRIMNIPDETFDNLLINAWEKGLIRFDVGAPIGRLDTKYLKTKEGNLFYYVKFLR